MTPITFSSAFCADAVQMSILEVYIIYLHVYMCQFMRFCHLSHVPRLRLACAFLKFHQTFSAAVLLDIELRTKKTKNNVVRAIFWQVDLDPLAIIPGSAQELHYYLEACSM